MHIPDSAGSCVVVVVVVVVLVVVVVVVVVLSAAQQNSLDAQFCPNMCTQSPEKIRDRIL